MLKRWIAILLCCGLLAGFAIPVSAAEEGSFALAVTTANAVIIAPVEIPYTQGQSVRDALLATDYHFVGLEQGFIYEVEGVTANFNIFYDGNGYNLDVEADQITALCIGVTSQYSEALLALIVRMAQLNQMGSVRNYPAAVQAYTDGLDAIRNADGQMAQEILDRINAAIEEYESLMNGPKYTLTVQCTQGDKTLSAPHLELTDAYGNVSRTIGTSIEVIAGAYDFVLSDGGFNRSEGSFTVEGDTTLKAALPEGEWFGDVRILDANKEPYPYVQDVETHKVTYQIVDTAKEIGSLYLNVGQGDVPDAGTTKLRTIYVGTNGNDYATSSRSWESTATALTYLVSPGLQGITFPLEAQYTTAEGCVQIQSYEMNIQRVPTLASLGISAEGTVLPLTFDPTTYDYEVVTVSDTATITATGFGSDYNITGTGDITVAKGGTTAKVEVSAEGKTTTYTIRIEKADAVDVRLEIPAGTTAEVINAAGAVIAPVEGVYHLIPGESYICRATKNQYYHTEFTFTAAAGQTHSVPAPQTQDWLQDIALYNGSNTTYRLSYESDTEFTATDHEYTYFVSDCNTTAYLQATSDYAVRALYNTQTTNAATNNVFKDVTVTRAVSASDTAQILSQVVAKSGLGNTVTLRVSKTEGGITWYQDYTLTLARVLHLTELALSDESGDLILLDDTGAAREFDRDVTAYTVSVNRDMTALTLSATFPNTSDTTECCGGYSATIAGQRYMELTEINLELDPAKDVETIAVTVCHEDTRSKATDYVLTIQKTDPVYVTFDVDPEDAIIFLTNDLNGKRLLEKDGVFALTPGVSYSYIITRTGYLGLKGGYVAPQEDGVLPISMEKAPANPELEDLPSAWPHLRLDNANNGVTSGATPISDEEALLYWATKIGDGYDKNACGCPILVDGYLYTYAGTTLYKVDTVSGEIVATGEMDHASSFAINPPTYADGMIFVGLADGSVQAFNAATLESLWIYRDSIGGQPNCSIIYHEGYVYTGFWVGEISQANYVCISATDEDPTNPLEEKLATWHYTSLGGFYWAGAYVCDDYLLIGTDDGAAGYTSGYARLLSFDPMTGVLLDEITLPVTGDIRSSITAYEGDFYFTNKGGWFFKASVDAAGQITGLQKLQLSNGSSNAQTPAMSTCTPTIYNDRAYVGISGTSQFGAYSGHNITVIDLKNWEIAYSVPTQGYPQTSGVLTTAYEEATGKVYVYFFDNYTPGKLRMLEDRPGQTRPSLVSTETYVEKGATKTCDAAYALFTPVGDQAQYAICSPIIDEFGTIYFKNDSAYLMAVGSTIEHLEINTAPDKLEYLVGEIFDPTGMTVTAHYTNGLSRDVTKYLTWSKEPLTLNDTDFVIGFAHVMYQNADGMTGVDYIDPFAVLQLTIQEDNTALGDVNGDGAIDAADAQRIMDHIGGKALTNHQRRLADVNRDGKINTLDIMLIMQYFRGIIDAFPVN